MLGLVSLTAPPQILNYVFYFNNLHDSIQSAPQLAPNWTPEISSHLAFQTQAQLASSSGSFLLQSNDHLGQPQQPHVVRVWQTSLRNILLPLFSLFSQQRLLGSHLINADQSA